MDSSNPEDLWNWMDTQRAAGVLGEHAGQENTDAGKLRRAPHGAFVVDGALGGRAGLDLIGDIRTVYDNYDFKTQILAASIRSANHVSQCALIGADVMTAPPAVIKGLASHVLTDKGLDQFMQDWAKTGQKIL